MSSDVPDNYWKNLLEIATAAHRNDDSDTAKNPPKLLDAESRKWIEQVMRDLVDEIDPGRKLASITSSLSVYAEGAACLNKEDVEIVEELCDQADDILLNAHFCEYFIKNGGASILSRFIYDSNSLSTRCHCLRLMSTLSANNPSAQDKLVEAGFLEKLLGLFQDLQEHLNVRLQSISAVSAIVSSNTNSYLHFLKLNGDQLFKKVFDENIITNSSFAVVVMRKLTSMAYTMRDCPTRQEDLKKVICEGYIAIVRTEKEEFPVELEHLRVFIEDNVEWADIDDDSRRALCACFKQESRRNLDEVRFGEDIRIETSLG